MNTTTQTIKKPQTSIFTQVLLIFLGLVFIFSGLIKLNDPVGTKIKLEEYFEVFSQDLPWAAGLFHGLLPLALPLAVFLCVAEVVLGVAVLIRYRFKATLYALLGLIVFFTFLTFYSAYFNRVTDCGCFGEAIKLKPWQSFAKDIVLLITILILFSQHKKILPLLTIKTSNLTMLVTTVLCFGLGIYAIFYLPPVDFLPYKIGDNIRENMQLPVDAKPWVYENSFVMKNIKNGQTQEFSEKAYNDGIWQDTLNWQYVDLKKKLIQQGDEPKIKDFAPTTPDGENITDKVLTGKQLLFIIQDFKTMNPKDLEAIGKLIKNLKGTEIQLLTASSVETAEIFRHEYQLAAPLLTIDEKVSKTMIRTNPGIMLLKDGTVLKKWSYMQIPDTNEIEILLQKP
ncbi:MAG: DoxX family protein [Verrucomicrobia bacterium]|nr:DoxX family protein [Cytophagales bacterium]